MSLLTVPRILATGSVVTAASAVRVGAGCAGLLGEHAPALVRLGLQGTAGVNAPTAQAAFRDELIALARESAELSWREMRRGVDALDGYTRPEHAPANGRPYRVKP